MARVVGKIPRKHLADAARPTGDIWPDTDLRDKENPIRGEYIDAMKQADLRNYGPLETYIKSLASLTQESRAIQNEVWLCDHLCTRC